MLLKPLPKPAHRRIGAQNDRFAWVCRAFTLIEMIGVLAVLTILATVIVWPTPTTMDVATRNLESTNLVKFATALQTSILRTRRVPGTNNNEIANVIAYELGLDFSDVQTNVRRNRRAFLFDPAFAIGTNAGYQGWTQTIQGGGLKDVNVSGLSIVKAPYQPRIIILSSLGSVLPTGILTSGLSTNDFATLWNNSDVPSSSGDLTSGVNAFSGWEGSGKGIGEDLKVQRIHLGPMFVHMILYNYNYPSTSAAQYTIDRILPLAVTNLVPSSFSFPNTNGVDNYYLKGTMVALLKSAAAGGSLDVEQILNRDTTFAYVQDVWRSTASPSQNVDPRAVLMGTALWAVAGNFMASPYYTHAANGVTPVVLVNDMGTFMTNYVNWANAGFPTAPGNPNYTAAKNSQTTLYADMANLVGATDQGNGTYQLNMVSGACTNPPIVAH